MARSLRLTIGLLLLALCAFLIWSGVVVGLRAFEPHADSGPALYLTAGAIWVALGVVCGAGSLVLFRWQGRRRPETT